MSRRDIILMGHPLLRRRAAPVSDPAAPHIQELIADMIETMEAAGGIGLAAPQIAVSSRVIIFRAPPDTDDPDSDDPDSDDPDTDHSNSGDPDSGGPDSGGPDSPDPEAWDERPERAEIEAEPLTILINPEIEALGEDREPGWEGCLSVPGLLGEVPRWRRIRYSGITPEGRLIERVAQGFHARVVQHEYDHLDGILYPQRMVDLTKLIFESQIGAGAEPVDEVEP